MSNDEETNDKKLNYITADKLPDGRLVEMIYEPVKKKTFFVVGIGDKTEIMEKIEILKDTRYLVPLKPANSMIRAGFIKMPSELGRYETNAELFNEIKTYIHKYSVLPNNFVTIAALYIMMTWVHEQFHVLPYLRVIGMYGTGKTRFLEVIGNICYKPMMAGGSASTASIFRAVDEIKGTLIFDEADFRNSEAWNEIVKILNSGHTKDFPVIRMEARADGGFTIKTFYVFGPKILASRVRFGDEALESRCLTQNLLPKNDLKVPIHLPESFKKETLSLRNKLLSFRFLNYANPVLQEQKLDSINFPRLKQSILAIVNTAKLVGNDIEKDVISFGLDYEKDLQLYQTREIESDVLICILELLLDKKRMNAAKGKIRIGDIADMYNFKFNDDFEDRKRKEYQGDSGFIESHYKASARKIGRVVSTKLMIKTNRDGDGFYIPPSECPKIKILMERYGITKDILARKDNPAQVDDPKDKNSF